jgi:prepilin-type N-terminal cleavage/methylation domain-containing protein
MLKEKTGFTLIEMTIAVVIVGIMASIAVPSYIKSQNKGRQSEAKAALGQIYTAERSYFSDASTYTQCLAKIGVVFQNRRFYAVTAVNDLASTNCGPNGDQSCTSYTFDSNGTALSTCVNADSAFDQTIREASSFSLILPSSTVLALGSQMSRSTFTAVAAGNVAPSNVTDTWTIDQNNNLFNSSPGI